VSCGTQYFPSFPRKRSWASGPEEFPFSLGSVVFHLLRSYFVWLRFAHVGKELLSALFLPSHPLFFDEPLKVLLLDSSETNDVLSRRQRPVIILCKKHLSPSYLVLLWLYSRTTPHPQTVFFIFSLFVIAYNLEFFLSEHPPLVPFRCGVPVLLSPFPLTSSSVVFFFFAEMYEAQLLILHGVFITIELPPHTVFFFFESAGPNPLDWSQHTVLLWFSWVRLPRYPHL